MHIVPLVSHILYISHKYESDEMNGVLIAMGTRRSIHNFKPDMVPQEMMNLLWELLQK